MNNTKKWFNQVVLETTNIQLIPLQLEHKSALLQAALDGNLVELWFTSIPTAESIDDYISKAISDFETDKGLAFVVIDKKSDQIIGTTRYTNAMPEHKRLEIGYTWYAKSFQKTYVNSECKILMLSFAFEQLNAIAVEFRTSWFNFASRSAIEKLGAKQDGVLRNHQIMPDGTLRDTVVFSIIENEWNSCKKALNYRIEQIHKKSSINY